MTPLGLVQRFWSKVERTTTCWLWTASKNAGGYGQICIEKRRPRVAHRVSWEIHYGPIPAGIFVLHRCDVPACVNPAHLFLGTKADNNADMKAKRRSTLGERNSRAKLRAAQILSIRVDPRSHSAIAADFGVSPSTVGLIKNRQRWSHV